jgi:dihydrofolate synthase/folylpolyglutamate synthase
MPPNSAAPPAAASAAGPAGEASDAILDRLQGLHPKEIDLSLGRIERLLAALGHPERRLPPVIHVAGTNGKGSTAAFLRAMLEADGRSVHVYTSPHLVHFHERIRLGAPGGGRFVDEAALAAALAEVEAVNADAPITLFEITTAAAFVLFARHPADVLILEVGLGGRLDATNVVARPLASVITPVSVDHTKFLGDTLHAIAGEKAGILKRGVPAVIAAQPAEAAETIEAAAARTGTRLFVSGQDWQAREERGRLVFEDGDGLLDLPPPRLIGRHQIENAGAAIATLRNAGLAVPQQAIAEGLRQVNWPARLQSLAEGRLVELLPAQAELWLDGAHNPDGGRAAAMTMVELEERSPRPLTLVVGMLDSKDSTGFLESFAGLATHLHAVPIPGNAHMRPPAEIVAAAEAAGITATEQPSVEAALMAIGLMASGPPRVLITGSLYLAGAVLAANGTPPI